MKVQLFAILIAAPALTGCLTPMATDAVDRAGAPPLVEVSSRAVALVHVARGERTYRVEVTYDDGLNRRFTLDRTQDDPQWVERYAPLVAEPDAVDVPVGANGLGSAPRESARLVGDVVEFREGGRLRRTARLPVVTCAKFRGRGALSYLKQFGVGVALIPLAIAGDVAVGALWAFGMAIASSRG
jgi:hypothetical protein